MFSLKRSSELNPTNVDPRSALPNNYGEIRTLKEDFENLQSGKSEIEEKSAPPIPEKPKATQNSAALSPPFPARQPQQSISPVTPSPPFQPKPEPKLKLSRETSMDTRGNMPAPFGTDSYFPEKSPFENIDQTPQAQETAKTPEKKSGSLLIILTSSLLFLMILGGSFYYYWFYVKKPSSSQIQEAAKTQQATTSQTQIQENKNVHVFTVDPAAGSTEFQKAFREMAENFLSGASENELAEARPVGQNNQQIPVKNFISLFSITLPETITQGFSNDDYSLFVKKENGEIRTGLVFKLSDSAGFAEELAQQEKNLPTGLGSLYLNQAFPPAEPTFNSAKYKSADIRYYNFPSPPNTSLDYSVIKGKIGGYLIFATSKNTIRSILDYMSEK
ncbi:MAG: hypothetical protein COZ87_01435 [Candidatus Moranbacteria bacterium CG_4_8_14_3_um_filter_43_15]|nr:MAG: hypothetical protein COZ87_01435 [Candidatus Moranbacteria bacterium CG_4_8_14_3_um_filter_43_15]PJA85889.1 MAG: hypothetical protein CO142_02510 [Candidatus Moranbacteria bacterium CG_4_9_14_3_um_filter_44_28]